MHDQYALYAPDTACLYAAVAGLVGLATVLALVALTAVVGSKGEDVPTSYAPSLALELACLALLADWLRWVLACLCALPRTSAEGEASAACTLAGCLAKAFLFGEASAEAAGRAAAFVSAALPRLGRAAKGGSFTAEETPQGLVLAQAEALVHRPLGFASSPSTPGTISSPWWTDFAHLIYWFYFMATFTTVVFFWYLYDLRVRRVETAHPIRETRGFSRAQTGDLVTAVLPLTWSATMVMHASTHSINFDENTAGTVFSLTVIAYQWGWNYYFPRDIVEKFETAPRVVGRGRVVSFEPTPMELAEATHLDSWALRATMGSRNQSRTGRLNTSPALSLVLPTDVPAGTLTSLLGGASNQEWRRALHAFFNDSGSLSYAPATTADLAFSPARQLGLEAPTGFRARPSVSVSGSRLTLTYAHRAPTAPFASFQEASWVTHNFFASTDGAPQSRSATLATAAAPSTLPEVLNLAYAPAVRAADAPAPEADLSYLRSPAAPSAQRLL